MAPLPSRTSSLHSRISQPIPEKLKMTPPPQQKKSLCYGYAVMGLPKEPNSWQKAVPLPQGKVMHMKGAINQYYVPEILGSSPRIEQDPETARSFYSAMRGSFPHDVEVAVGKTQPQCVSHCFVIQQDASRTLFGVTLRVWSRADDKRCETIRELRKRMDSSSDYSQDENYWIPYALCFLSRYPLYSLLSDYLKAMWIHWNKATNLFHAEEVSRILTFPAPRPNDLVRIDMKDYALCYQFPPTPVNFQNFPMWPLFECLSLQNIVGVIEAALCPTSRIIFASHSLGMLSVASETIRYLIRVYEWSGLYVPVVHSRNLSSIVLEPGPYILGITSECRGLFSAPPDALLVDLDRNHVITTSPPTMLKPSQRAKFISRLQTALCGDIPITGVPKFLKEAYPNGKLTPCGQVIVMKGKIDTIEEPDWWKASANIYTIIDRVCQKSITNTRLKAVFSGSQKQQVMTKVSMRYLNELVRDKNAYSREVFEAYQDYINLKGRTDTEIQRVTKRNNFLVEELENWKQQFEKFQAFAAQLTQDAKKMKTEIESHKREARRLTHQIDQQQVDFSDLKKRLSNSEKERENTQKSLENAQQVVEALQRERDAIKVELGKLKTHYGQTVQQREEAQKVVLHLRNLIDGQAQHMQVVVQNMASPAEASPEEPLTESNRSSIISSRTATPDLKASPEMESKFFNSISPTRRTSTLSLADTTDRAIRERTDEIAVIIKNITEQCAKAVDSLNLAAEDEGVADTRSYSPDCRRNSTAMSNLTCDTIESCDSEIQSDDEIEIVDKKYRATMYDINGMRAASRQIAEISE
ncbi:DENN domain-containing protein [Neolecta irregularis DAH-3]|uniref:DENN domain-containing protein n=1 Tax=Neolecta irregularis (strain DAH-3) TaxID=1198029 RepID=A0A1U7LU31_NEOID|nr:DENN domain-containing protein [Neolecta irregularis DAH-3]|eukprot:OLL26154.1 DENN domain-containing protein [Neolecta irregularis DAH-3]